MLWLVCKELFFAFVAPCTSHVALWGLVKLIWRVGRQFLLGTFINIPAFGSARFQRAIQLSTSATYHSHVAMELLSEVFPSRIHSRLLLLANSNEWCHSVRMWLVDFEIKTVYITCKLLHLLESLSDYTKTLPFSTFLFIYVYPLHCLAFCTCLLV